MNNYNACAVQGKTYLRQVAPKLNKEVIMKVEGVKRKGNLITIQCQSRGESNFVFDQVKRKVNEYRWLSAPQWDSKTLKRLVIEAKNSPKKPYKVTIVGDPTKGEKK